MLSEIQSLHRLRQASQIADALIWREVRKADMTGRRLTVLLAVGSKPGCSQTDLVEITGIDRSTCADLVRKLRKKGLITRYRTKADARRYAVNLTDEGSRVLKSMTPALLRAAKQLPAHVKNVDCLEIIAPVGRAA